MKSKKTCFVIMPFGKKTANNPYWHASDTIGTKVDFDKVYDEIIEPAIDGLDIECMRCDKIAKSGSIHKKMIKGIAEAHVAIVDLSTINPNVFYELGVRHALRRGVTVLLRCKGLEKSIPFNIGGMTVIDYDSKNPGAAIDKIRAHTNAGLLDRESSDSLVFDVLTDLQVTVRPPQPLTSLQYHEFTITGVRGKRIGVATGDIARVQGVDIWVNSENTEMQMARVYDWSISGTIRYLGAKKDTSGRIKKDLIALALAEVLDGDTSVPPGTVVPTLTPQLHETHGVHWVFHAAAVVGQRSLGYQPIANVNACVSNSLELAETPEIREADVDQYGGRRSSSILFPLFGAGVASTGLQETAKGLIETAINHLRQSADTAIRRVYFLTWTDVELEECLAILRDRSDTKQVATKKI